VGPIVAPPGGLIIEARDVNGDNAVDLVLTTAWFRQPVAIFLNDGHGNFSRFEPAAFPGAFDTSNANWTCCTSEVSESIEAPPKPPSVASSEESKFSDLHLLRDSISHFVCSLAHNSFLISRPGRAPPFEVSSL